MSSRFCNTLEREIKHANSINAVCLNNFLSHTENKKYDINSGMKNAAVNHGSDTLENNAVKLKRRVINILLYCMLKTDISKHKKPKAFVEL